jgi:hypothetical protein
VNGGINMSYSEFNSLAVQKFTFKKRNRNSVGDFYDISEITNWRGFIDFGNHFITTPEGEKKESTAIVFLTNDNEIDITHDYYLISQTYPSTRNDLEVIKIDPIDNPLKAGKIHHYEIHVR